MSVKRAKSLSNEDISSAIDYTTRYSRLPQRDSLLILLTCYAGLRIQEACSIHISDFTDSRGKVMDTLFVSSRGAKSKRSREVPLRQELIVALQDYLHWLERNYPSDWRQKPIFFSCWGDPLKPNTGAQQLRNIYKAIGLQGCSSHSGRRTFGTRTAQLFAKLGGSLLDTQALLGHADIKTTLGYIDCSPFRRKVVDEI